MLWVTGEKSSGMILSSGKERKLYMNNGKNSAERIFNEVLAFQVIVEADIKGAQAVEF